MMLHYFHFFFEPVFLPRFTFGKGKFERLGDALSVDQISWRPEAQPKKIQLLALFEFIKTHQMQLRFSFIASGVRLSYDAFPVGASVFFLLVAGSNFPSWIPRHRSDVAML